MDVDEQRLFSERGERLAQYREEIDALTKERDKYKMECLVKFNCEVCSGALESENDKLRAALDAVLKEAIWAMEFIQSDYTRAALKHAEDFLAGPAVRDYLARQEQK